MFGSVSGALRNLNLHSTKLPVQGTTPHVFTSEVLHVNKCIPKQRMFADIQLSQSVFLLRSGTLGEMIRILRMLGLLGSVCMCVLTACHTRVHTARTHTSVVEVDVQCACLAEADRPQGGHSSLPQHGRAHSPAPTCQLLLFLNR